MGWYYQYLFPEKRAFCVFFLSRKEVTSLNLWLIRWPNGKNFLFLIQLHCYSQYQNRKVTPKRCYRLYKFYWNDKGEKSRTFLVSVREMLRLILNENSFPFNGKHYQYRPTVPRGWAQRQQFPFQHFPGIYWNTKFNYAKTVFKPTVWICYIDDNDSFSLYGT